MSEEVFCPLCSGAVHRGACVEAANERGKERCDELGRHDWNDYSGGPDAICIRCGEDKDPPRARARRIEKVRMGEQEIITQGHDDLGITKFNGSGLMGARLIDPKYPDKRWTVMATGESWRVVRLEDPPCPQVLLADTETGAMRWAPLTGLVVDRGPGFSEVMSAEYEERDWLEDHPEDQHTYAGKAVAVHPEQGVVASGEDLAEVMKRTKELGLHDEVCYDRLPEA